MLITNAPKGTKDVLPSESYKWQYIEEKIRQICDLYNCNEVRVPTFEHTELFLRGVGDNTDIVNKEMYTFLDKAERSITLKPEGTAGVARCFVENSIFNNPMPIKMYYLNSPVFRYEQPQSGRYREHHQFGVEMFGSDEPTIDAEVISVAMDVFKKLGVGNLELNINSIGCSECRPKYNAALLEYIGSSIDKMCTSCQERYEKNPLRILDCKVPTCKEVVKNAPTTIEHLCEDCSEHFERLQKNLDSMGIAYKVNPQIVRGLDYYTKTVFEIITNSIGAQGTVCGGGRYNNLIEEIGGKPMPAAGFGMGMERLLMVMENDNVEIPEPKAVDLYIAATEDDAIIKSMEIARKLRAEGIKVEAPHMKKSLKAQMKYANKLNCRYVLMLWDEDIKNGEVLVKDMDENGEEKKIKIDEIVKEINI
ncbi:MAG: histidine--tRNA ligase [Eubacteriales bacterium]